MGLETGACGTASVGPTGGTPVSDKLVPGEN